jgi:hypothetical protein
MTVKVTKIKAIREDPKDPRMDCYANDVATQAALEISKVFSNQPNPKPESSKQMSIINYGNPELNPTIAPKRFVVGVIANDNPVALVKTLNRLGLCSNEMADPLKKLAAQKRPLSEFFQVSVYDVDMALKGVEASPEDRIGFKSSLKRAGLMTRD